MHCQTLETTTDFRLKKGGSGGKKAIVQGEMTWYILRVKRNFSGGWV
jgi:hypothetical protein